jgi:hypothetical protein
MKIRGTGFAGVSNGSWIPREIISCRKTALAHENRDAERGFMVWTILVVGLTLALIVIGQISNGLLHLLLAGATLILVIQIFSGDGTVPWR